VKEASVTLNWKHYVEKNPPKVTQCWELKLVNLDKQKSFAFNRVAPHQVDGLLASLEGFWMKIPDTAASNGFSAQKPFDAVYIMSEESSVVVVFWKPRKYKKAIKIPIKTFISIRDAWPRKSIREEELVQIDGVEMVNI